MAIVALLLSGRAEAKCARLVLVISGEVEGDPDGQLIVRAEATPTARTTQKPVVREGPRFEATLLFDPAKGNSLFRGHDCSVDPKSVRVTLLRGDKAIMTRELSFEKDFVAHPRGLYRVRETLVLKGLQ